MTRTMTIPEAAKMMDGWNTKYIVAYAHTQATRFFRMARRMQAHGCSPEKVAKVREKGWSLKNIDEGNVYSLTIADMILMSRI